MENMPYKAYQVTFNVTTGSWEIKSIEPAGLVGFELGLINLCSLSKVWSAILN